MGEGKGATEDRKDINVRLLDDKPSLLRTELNILFLLLVVSTFLVPLFVQDLTIRLLAIEVGILLVSLKFAYFLHNESKVIKAEFWTLASIEWRLSKISKDLQEQKETLQKLLTTSSTGSDNKEGEKEVSQGESQ
ncbi:MAG: hypothetical protein N2234_07525 [Planctomycetota bacterium]|nr:hypothetical protein [Planctomycetota bacterium]